MWVASKMHMPLFNKEETTYSILLEMANKWSSYLNLQTFVFKKR
jgi:hypothetical protein